MTNILTATPLGAPTPIDARSIERELNALWQETTDNKSPDQRHQVSRTRVLNLIVVTRSAAAAERATEVAAKLTLRHPHRAIVVNALPQDPGDSLEAWVQAHCLLPIHGRPRVCGEQITIVARGPAVERVPNTLLPLLVPDVPVMLWWMAGAPFDDLRFAKFGDLIDRVVVDSATFDAPETTLAKMAALTAQGTRISDLSWSRLTPWRELAAQFFDAPAQVPHLYELTSVTVDYEAQVAPGDRSQALLLVGWLAARLGWQVAAPLTSDRGNSTVQLKRTDGSLVQVTLRPAPMQDDALDRLAMLTLTSPQATFSVARDPAPDCAMTRAEVAGMSPLERRVRLEQLDEAGLLSEELRLLGQDITYAGAVRMAAALLGATE
ncbi:MAG: glucose-6-phosphate dehydrogenase assembly protein OpcA [Chloroflexi bacterium SZAS-1]|nr:glucose-6-phosphate dehydrogenase assembly protein OpcA [Chloroflexi bacterium SZAS-1]HNP84758.1 glucose-6-phosphate dehydrogenase assembly protein OpcA [Kouleothrix sp.]